MERLVADQDLVNAVISDLAMHLIEKMDEKGLECFSSTHEAYGKIEEERYEALQAMHQNQDEQFEAELLDIAIAALWGVVSYRAYRNAEADKVPASAEAPK